MKAENQKERLLHWSKMVWCPLWPWQKMMHVAMLPWWKRCLWWQWHRDVCLSVRSIITLVILMSVMSEVSMIALTTVSVMVVTLLSRCLCHVYDGLVNSMIAWYCDICYVHDGIEDCDVCDIIDQAVFDAITIFPKPLPDPESGSGTIIPELVSSNQFESTTCTQCCSPISVWN